VSQQRAPKRCEQSDAWVASSQHFHSIERYFERSFASEEKQLADTEDTVWVPGVWADAAFEAPLAAQASAQSWATQ